MIRKILHCIIALGIILIPELGCRKDPEKYPEVKIGNQIWMTKNLDVDTFRNGEKIPEAKTNEEWKKALVSKQPAWCYYDNDRNNWFAVNDSRGLAPDGWHIPSDKEWITLENYLGGDEIAGIKMKSKVGWTYTHSDSGEITGNGTDSIGFNGLPGGSLNSDILASSESIGFVGIGSEGIWWSSSGPNTGSVGNRKLILYNGVVFSQELAGDALEDGLVYLGSSGYIVQLKGCGFSVRCIKDNKLD